MKDIVIVKNKYIMSIAKLIHRSDKKSHVIVGKLTGILDKKLGGLSYITVENDDIILLSEFDNIIKSFTEHKDNEINVLKGKIKSTDLKDYSEEMDKSYKKIKNQIIRTSEHMLEGIEFEDEKFENKLKAICDLKKQLFSIPCEEAREARKYNGTIKFNIKKIEREFNERMMLMDVDDFIDKLEDKN